MYMSVLILNREQVKQVISMKEVIQEVREVYRLKSQGKSVIWPLVNYEFVDEHAAMDIRSGYIKGVQLHGLKMLNNFPENREKGLPPFNGIMMVYDSNTGIPVSVMDASYVTCMRTGAAGALGVDLLARKDAKHLFILGAGKQAPFQIAATLLLRPAIDKVYIADPMFPDNAVQFAAHIAQQLSDDFGIDASGVEFLPALDMAAAVGDSDAIITVTPLPQAHHPEGVAEARHPSELPGLRHGIQAGDREHHLPGRRLLRRRPRPVHPRGRDGAAHQAGRHQCRRHHRRDR